MRVVLDTIGRLADRGYGFGLRRDICKRGGLVVAAAPSCNA